MTLEFECNTGSSDLSRIFEVKVTKPFFSVFLIVPSTVLIRFFVAINQHLKIILFYRFELVTKTFTKKKNPEIIKENLLNSLKESDTVEEQEFNIQNRIDQRDIDIIKRYK